MGHIRLGRLPRTRPWRAVAQLLQSPDAGPQNIGAATLRASAKALEAAKHEPGCADALRILSELALAARHTDSFAEVLDRFGIPQTARNDGDRLLGTLAQLMDATSGARQPRTVLSDIADRAFREVLLGRIRAHADTLFGLSAEDVRAALRAHSSDAGYRELTRDWFGRFLGRTIQSVVDRDLGNVVGGEAFPSSAAALQFHHELMGYAVERTAVLQDFAPAWLSRALWQEGELRPATFQRYFAYAIEKVLRDIGAEGDTP